MNKGFTLIEFLVVMGIMVLVFGFGLFFSMDAYRGYTFRSERDLAISILQKARAQSISNINQQPHGVHIDSVGKQYIIFEGTTFSGSASSNIYVPFVSSAVSHSGMSDVFFNQLDGGVATPPAAWPFTDPTSGRTSSVTINAEGQITWTN
jgi:prepilin-type N-terminal cleavage/methylation domain-containing protein